MKILELRLTAFGPFSDRTLDLSGGSPGLHVIYGHNEAGKSSALRALHALLFGIDMRTSDNFVHPYDRLRLGGRLRLAAGAEIDFTRIKRQKGTLRAPDGSTLPENALDRFVAGVSSEQFERFWGIDHDRLVQGGREILERKGDVGESLFAAGLGASRLGALRRRLDADATALFAPHAQKPPINHALSQVKEIRSALHAATVSAEQCAKREGELRRVLDDIAAKTKEADGLGRERMRLERLQRVLPALRERAALHERLAPVAAAVRLADDFATRRERAHEARRAARDRRERCAKQFEETDKLLRDLGPSPPLVAESAHVAELHQRLGSHRKAARDRPALDARRLELRQQAKRLVAEVRAGANLETAESLRPFYGRRSRIQRLAGEREKLEGSLEAALDAIQKAADEATALARTGRTLPPARETERLVVALEEARSRGDVESSRDKAAQEAKRIEAEVHAGLKRLGLSSELTDRLAEVGVPTRGMVSRFEKQSTAIEEEERDDNAAIERVARALRDLGSKSASLRRKTSVPTEEDLAAVRKKRDSAFELLRTHFEQNQDVSSAARELLGRGKLVDLYPRVVEEADAVADRMRQEADRVAEFASLSEQRAQLEAERKEIEGRREVRAKSRADLDVAWHRAWRQVTAEPPAIADAESWQERFDHLVVRAKELDSARTEIAKTDRWIETQLRRLLAAVQAAEPQKSSPEGLAAAVTLAQKVLSRIQGEARLRDAHQTKCDVNERAKEEAKEREKKARAEISSWGARWKEAVGDVLGAGASLPEDVLVALERVEKVLAWLDEAGTLDARISGIDRDAKEFRADVRALAERLGEASALTPEAEDAWLEPLHARVTEENRVEVRRSESAGLLKRLRAEAKEADDEIEAAQSKIEALLAEADCAAEGELPAAEQRSAERRSCESALATVDRELVRNGGGTSVADLEAEAAQTSEDAITTGLSAIGSETESIEAALTALREQRATIQAELQGVRGQSLASERREDLQAALAEVRDQALSYARLRVASTLLARRIDEYRRTNQAPLLKRAGEMFRAMTLGSFESLDVGGEDEPVLMGVRPDGHQVDTSGMSDGSVDQLFLALRLAAVEAACGSGEPMPFVVDDVLVKFDDVRASAALAVLAEVASKTQVVLFTHHERVRECAEKLSAPAGVVIQTL